MKTSVDADLLRRAIAKQNLASLQMLRDAIETCPDDLWLDETPTNAFWQVAYHTLFFAHLYLQVDETAFEPWDEHKEGAQYPDGISGPPNTESELPLLPDPYTRDQALRYCDFCTRQVADWVDAIDLGSEQSGFYWYQVPKIEHQLVNIRHIQHGAAQLADRLRAALDAGIRWRGTAKLAD